MSDNKLCKFNVIANQFFLLAAYFFLIPITYLFMNWDGTWTASNTTGRAGMVFGAIYCSSSFFNLSAIVDQRPDIINNFLSFLSITCYAAISTDKHIAGYMQHQTGWAFRFMWTAWTFHTLAFLVSSFCNVPSLMKNGWRKFEKMEQPSTKAFTECN